MSGTYPYLTDTLANVLVLQEDLHSLCRDRPLQTRECFRLNSYYGMDRILKRYAGLDEDYPLKLALPHGLVLSRDGVRPAYVRAQVPAIWCYPRYLERAYARVTGKQIISGASPYLYLLRMLPQEVVPAEQRAGTIFFPAHSTRHVTADMDTVGLAEQLLALPEHLQPITVCMYWYDLLEGRHQAFEAAGFRIVSAGHMFDPDFLLRLHVLCLMHQYAASNELGSHIFYSIQSGCSFFLVDAERTGYKGAAKHLAAQYLAVPERTGRRMRQLFAQPLPRPSCRQRMVADYMLGARFMQTPAALLSTLVRLERADTYGYISRRPGKLPAVMFSPRLKRSLTRTWHVVRGAMRAIMLRERTRGRGSKEGVEQG